MLRVPNKRCLIYPKDCPKWKPIYNGYSVRRANFARLRCYMCSMRHCPTSFTLPRNITLHFQKQILDGDLSRIGRAYEHCDRKRNEVAHAQYSSQLRQSRTDPMSIGQTMNQNPSQHPVPAVIYCYAQSRSTLFAPLAAAMDAFSSGIDPSLFTAARS
ncbi:hypothetical protein CPC08DRAFT_503525 [Agrocybe pediades]|nr:hypothetical protein CPC08DRAFT_503525 [Agrocybe pediades]